MIINKIYLAIGFLFIVAFSFKNEAKASLENNQYSISNPNKNVLNNQNQFEEGKEIYNDFCIQCHGGNGKGDGVKIPPLAGSDWLIKKRRESIHAVKFGQNGAIVVNKIKFNNNMPAMGLSNKEVADVMNYVMNSWGNRQDRKVTEKEVAEVL